MQDQPQETEQDNGTDAENTDVSPEQNADDVFFNDLPEFSDEVMGEFMPPSGEEAHEKEIPPVEPIDLPDAIEPFVPELLHQFLSWGWHFIQYELMTVNMIIQLTLIFGSVIPAIIFAPRMRDLVVKYITPKMPTEILKRLSRSIVAVALPLAIYLFMALFSFILVSFGQKVQVMRAAESLLLAWILVRLATLVIRSPMWSKVAFYTIWPIMVLNAFGVLDVVIERLEAISLTLGGGDETHPALTLSMMDVIQAGLIFGVFFWLANMLSGVMGRQIERAEELNPSLKALFVKVLDLLLPIIAMLLALQVVGFNLASLAIFGGAVGIGIGLGLQGMISNFFAGVTMLADKSIKPGDVIEIGDTFGWVTVMKSRYVAIRTRDGTEHLVPNDHFIANGVVNWSHADNIVRLHVSVGVAYDTPDMMRVKELCEESATKVKRVLANPMPQCQLVEFGDNSVNFDLRFWINDPTKGVTNVKSDVMLHIWQALKEENIEIPFPQRDLHLRSSDIDLDFLMQNEAPVNKK